MKSARPKLILRKCQVLFKEKNWTKRKKREKLQHKKEKKSEQEEKTATWFISILHISNKKN